MLEATFNRYGVKTPVPDRLPGYPEPKPLYRGEDGVNAVLEHGEYALLHMLGEAANRLPIPKASVPGYLAREQEVIGIMRKYAN